MYRINWRFFIALIIVIFVIVLSSIALNLVKDGPDNMSLGSRFNKEFLPPEGILGQGGFGLVVQARNKIDRCPYAVKIADLPENNKEQERALREVRVLAQLDHENIVRYYSAWVEQSEAFYNKLSLTRPYKIFIQMELCQGSLHDWLINDQVFNARRVKAELIFSQIVSAVEYIHLNGLIHRDLKPGNILFALDGKVKVGDFGLVTAMGGLSSDGDRLVAADAGYKHTHGVGTPNFMSPEQLQGQPYSYKVDIYSLGLILFLLLQPFAMKKGGYNCLRNIRNLQFPLHLYQMYPTESGVLKLMLSEDPSRRPTASGVRARAPLYQNTDDKYHFELPTMARSILI